MSTILIVGDSPLGAELAGSASKAGHTVLSYLYNQHGPETFSTASLLMLLQESANHVDAAVEAVLGDRAAKRQVITALADAFIGTAEPLLSATLNASATEVASWTAYPERVVGWAALPPLDSADVVELAPALTSNQETINQAKEFWSSLQKECVDTGDTAGGILPRIVANLVNEASFALMEAVASAEDIDQAMKLGTNYPHGPLAWGDLIGIDQVVGIMRALGEVNGPDHYRPSPLLQRMAQAGLWGVRTGKGFYTYPPEN
jgi:3-hydroxybutyryl-CoA dehydrogenase